MRRWFWLAAFLCAVFVVAAQQSGHSTEVDKGFAWLRAQVQVDGAVACGAPWFGPTFPSSGSVLALANQRMSTFINAGSLPAATYRGNICVSSNALAAPVSAVPVTLTVTP